MPACAGDIVWSPSGFGEAVSVHERVSVIDFAEATSHFIHRGMSPLQLGAVLAPKDVGNKMHLIARAMISLCWLQVRSLSCFPQKRAQAFIISRLFSSAVPRRYARSVLDVTV